VRIGRRCAPLSIFIRRWSFTDHHPSTIIRRSSADDQPAIASIDDHPSTVIRR